MKSFSLESNASVRLKLGLSVLLIAFAVGARIVPHPANFVPLAAVALFGAAVLPRRWAVIVPLVAMVASDLVVGLHPLVFYTWGSFAVIAFAGSHFLGRVSASRVVVSSLAASVFFYLVTNFGVWTQGLMYPMTPGGLLQCYINALPFFRATLLGDLFYSGALFGSYAIVLAWATQLRSNYVRV